MDYKKPIGLIAGRGSSKPIIDLKRTIEHKLEFNEYSTQSDIEKILDENYGINRESMMKLYVSIEQVLSPIIESMIAAGLTFEEIRKLLKISKKSRPILSKTIVLKKSSKKPYKQRRYKRFQNHR